LFLDSKAGKAFAKERLGLVNPPDLAEFLAAFHDNYSTVDSEFRDEANKVPKAETPPDLASLGTALGNLFKDFEPPENAKIKRPSNVPTRPKLPKS